MRAIRERLTLVTLAAMTWTATAGAQPLDFVTVGAAGNRGTLTEERPNAIDAGSFGAVAYEFRITRTEIRAREWLTFLNAYRPFAGNDPFNGNLLGDWIGVNSSFEYYLPSGVEDCPMDVSWEMAARYCNWLHNGQVSEAWAFASGAYDTTRFTRNADGSYNHQGRLPDAKYWIPSYDETIKAFYYDPNRYGSGMQGYWLYPGQSDSPLPLGLPQNGGMTNVGWNPGSYPLPSAAQYPFAASAWGLLDTSGGASEWTDSRRFMGEMLIVGSSYGSGDFGQQWLDRLDYFERRVPPTGTAGTGFRVATSVPTPATLVASCVLLLLRTRRRRSR